ncbi:MAG: extracellular solute-binding protein [Clostridiales bacterium]|nr:extracellular solute-binding protein [Clostridiales bacterium]
MKKRIIHLIALTVAICIAVSAVACAKPDTPDDTLPPETTPSAVADETTEPAETENLEFVSDLSGLNYGGEEISFFVEGQAFAKDEFDSFEVSGDLVRDSVYRRNSQVESALNIKMKVEVASDSSVYNVGNRIRSLVKAGDHYYDIVTLPGYTHTSYALEGDFHNLVDVENLNLKKLYWTQGFNDIMCNGKQQYVASGAYSVSMIRNMYITLYNKTIMESRNLPDLYDLTVSGDWTVQKQIELIKGLYEDTNGDGKRDENDFYGFVSGLNTSVDPYWVSFHFPILQLDRDSGNYYMDIDKEKMLNILQIFIDLISGNDDTWNKGASGGDVDGSNATTSIDKFAQKGCAMTTTMIYMIESRLTKSGFEDDYGIVPIPKYNSDQDSYYTHTQDQLSLMAVVSTADRGDLPMIGAVMDTIAYYSYREVFPAYYENALSFRYLQNAESQTMLDLIYRSLKIEGCFIYSSSFAILGELRSIASMKMAKASLVNAKTSAWPAKVDALNEGLAKIAD